MDSERKKTIIIRAAITALMTAVGFAFPLVWIPPHSLRTRHTRLSLIPIQSHRKACIDQGSRR